VSNTPVNRGDELVEQIHELIEGEIIADVGYALSMVITDIMLEHPDLAVQLSRSFTEAIQQAALETTPTAGEG
jgi:hypothetical protein